MCTASPANGRNCEPVTLTSIGLEYQVDLWRSRYKLHRPGGESTVFVISCHLSQVFWQVIAIMKPNTPIIRIPFLSSMMWWTELEVFPGTNTKGMINHNFGIVFFDIFSIQAKTGCFLLTSPQIGPKIASQITKLKEQIKIFFVSSSTG